MPALGLETDIVDHGVYDRAVERFRSLRIQLPTFASLAGPTSAPSSDPDAADPANLLRVHWYNDSSRRGLAPVPEHVVLPSSLTGVAAPIVVVFGDRFPMIGAHKVLAAYACLAPRIVTGQFDPTTHRAVWPSTGNYCRGGVAISRIMGCRGVAVLPAGMSRERFDWLARWVASPEDVVATPGSESNVKEIYDACAEMAADPANVIFNQFAEFGNHLVHHRVTGPALGHVFESTGIPGLAAFVSASGSAGTLGAGDHLKDEYGARIVAVEAVECPTMLRNGYGEHNIQGIGDKHIPLIHNVFNTDLVVGVSDRATDALSVMFSSDAGLRLLAGRGVPAPVLASLSSMGLSSVCNVVAAVKTAAHLGLGPDDAIITVATDGAAMYGSERARIIERDHPDGVDEVAAASSFHRWMLGAGTDDVLDATPDVRERIFNLGYYTWVEQQGVALADFDARRDQAFWKGLRPLVDTWDEMIVSFNDRAQ